MKSFLFMLMVLSVSLFAQPGEGYSPNNEFYDFVIAEVVPIDSVDQYDIRTFDSLTITFNHSGIPLDVVPDSLMDYSGNVFAFTLANDSSYWNDGEFTYAISKDILGPGYFVGFVRTIGGTPVQVTDWTKGDYFLLGIPPDSPFSVGVGVK